MLLSTTFGLPLLVRLFTPRRQAHRYCRNRNRRSKCKLILKYVGRRRSFGLPSRNPSSFTTPNGNPVLYSARYATCVSRVRKERERGSRNLGTGAHPQVRNRFGASQGRGPGACRAKIGFSRL